MTELTAVQVLQRLDAPVRPRREFADALRTSLLQELEGAPSTETVEAPARFPLRERLRQATPRAPRPGWPRWARVAIAAAAAIAVAVTLVIVRLPGSPPSTALAVIRLAQTRFADLPAFRATTLRRTPGEWLHDSAPELDEPVPDLVYESEISYLDRTHFRNAVTSATWDGHGPRAALAAMQRETPQTGEYWAADGQYFVHYLPEPGSFTAMPVDDEPALDYFAAGMLDPDVEVMADPSDGYVRKHCEKLPNEQFIGRTVYRLHCQDRRSWQYERGPTMDIDTYIDVETGMLLKLSSRSEGVWFEVTSLELDPGFEESAFAISVPEGANVQWTGGGAPPERFRQTVDANVTQIPIGNAPSHVVAAFGSIWVGYTEGGTGDNAVGGRDAIARIDPATNEVTARIVAPTDLTEVPKGWSSPLVFMSAPVVGDDELYVTYRDSGNRVPRHIAAIDPVTNTLEDPMVTIDTESERGIVGVSLGFADGALWVVDGQGDPDAPPDEPLSALLRVDPSTGDVVDTIPIGGLNAGGGPMVGDDSIWLVGFPPSWSETMLFKIEPATGRVTKIPIPNGAISQAYAEGDMWIRYSDSRLLRFDTADERIERWIDVGAGDGSVEVSDGLVWVTNPADNSLMAIDPSTNEVVREINVGAYPADIAVADGSVWVANYRDGTVSRVAI